MTEPIKYPTDSDFIYSYAVDPDGTMHLEWAEGALAESFVIATADFRKGGFFHGIVHADDRQQLEQRLQQFRSGGGSLDIFRVTDRGGRERVIRAFSKAVRNKKENRVVRVVGTVQDITGQIEDHKRALQTQALMNSVYDSAPIGVVLHDRDGSTRVRVNRAFCQMVGHTREHLLNEPYSRLTHPDDLAESLELRRRMFDGEIDHFETEKRYQHQNGSVVWAHVYTTGIKNPDDQIAYYVSFIEDITRRKQAELRLSENDKRYRDLIEGSMLGIIITTKSRDILLVNQAFANMFGYDSVDEIMALKQSEVLIAPHDRARLNTMRSRRAAGRQVDPQVEYDGVKKSGHIFRVSAVTQSLEWEGRHAFISTIMDVTERRRNQQELKSSEEKYRNLIEGSIQGMLIAGREREILFCNRSLATMLGYSEVSEVENMKTTDRMIAPYEFSRIESLRQKRITGQDVPPENEVDFVRRDGEIIRMQTLSRRLIWDGEPAIQTTFIDITERKRAERALISAKEQAEMANRSKSEFLANMSHELRTPLNAIIGFSEVMKDGLFGPVGNRQYAEYLDDIYGSGRHLLLIINDILDVSKVEAGAMDIVLESLNVVDIIDMSVRMVRERAINAGLRISIEVEEEIGTIYADEVRVKQILLNLLSNAVKFTKPGGRIEISAHSVGVDQIGITVADTGVGIAPDRITQVFQPFVQDANTFDLAQEGTGLGLTLAKSLSELMQGSIEMSSDLGKGTQVSICLPKSRPPITPVA